MGKFQKIAVFWLSILCFFPHGLMAQTLYNTQVKVIHAGTGPSHIDPGIRDLIQEIEPVFKYTDYRLIKKQQMKLQENQAGTLSLPDNRTLVVTPLSLSSNRIKYQIRIEKNQASLFQTQVLLQNHSSITIGGPRHEKGVLLINVKGDAE